MTRRVPDASHGAPGKRLVQRAIAAFIPGIIRRSLRSGLAGIWMRGDLKALPAGSLLLANHHAWWDGYLVWWLARQRGVPFAVLMDDANLAKFPFFEFHGAIPASQPRRFLRAVEEGAVGVVFGEAAVQPPGPLQAVRPGAERIARWAGVPLHPLAIRVVQRGMQHPEAYLWLLDACPDADQATTELQQALSRIDEAAGREDPEVPLPGFTLAQHGASSPDRVANRFKGWWS